MDHVLHANDASLSFGEREFYLTLMAPMFGAQPEQNGKLPNAPIVKPIALSPKFALDLKQLFERQIARYEEQFGPIQGAIVKPNHLRLT